MCSFHAQGSFTIKDMPRAAEYYDQTLITEFKHAMLRQGRRLKAMDRAAISVKLTWGSCSWKKPGIKYNKIAYWSVTETSWTISDAKIRKALSFER